MFDLLLGSLTIEKGMKTIHREAVRAVIIQGGKILLIHSNKGDYKFPGGGVEKNKTHIEALQREMKEETGYKYCHVKEKIGLVVERKLDEFEDNSYFQMNSHYYLCELHINEKEAQKLDDYELEQQFSPEWITIESAIKQNEKLQHLPKMNKWITREILVLNELQKQELLTPYTKNLLKTEINLS